MMDLTVSHSGLTQRGTVLRVGDVVEYLGHLPGGNIKIRLNEDEDVAHPLCFKELRCE